MKLLICLVGVFNSGRPLFKYCQLQFHSYFYCSDFCVVCVSCQVTETHLHWNFGTDCGGRSHHSVLSVLVPGKHLSSYCWEFLSVCPWRHFKILPFWHINPLFYLLSFPTLLARQLHSSHLSSIPVMCFLHAKTQQPPSSQNILCYCWVPLTFIF